MAGSALWLETQASLALLPGEELEGLGLALPTDSPTLPPGGDYLRLRHGE